MVRFSFTGCTAKVVPEKVFLQPQRPSSAVDAALCVNPLEHRVRKSLPIMERKTGTASTDEKDRGIAKVLK
jgi:hypothetical protein